MALNCGMMMNMQISGKKDAILIHKLTVFGRSFLAFYCLANRIVDGSLLKLKVKFQLDSPGDFRFVCVSGKIGGQEKK